MKQYSIKVKQRALRKTGYSRNKMNFIRQEKTNSRNINALRKSHKHIKKFTAEFVSFVETYEKIDEALSLIISGVNRTNAGKRIKLVIDRVIDGLVPPRLRSKFAGLKKELEQLSKISGLDPSALKNKILVKMQNRIYNEIMEEAERIYDKVYFKSDHSYIKRALSKGEIAEYLRKGGSSGKLKLFVQKLADAGKVISKIEDVVDKSGQLIRAYNFLERGQELIQQQSKLKTPEDYKNIIIMWQKKLRKWLQH
ncbi:MAG: hypothetical protein GY750_20705 [Lentisphaerae bacterium]|nr:hypothetical protein [Lentisphaerota bacterium]MCP4103812.1 hypothetical protein [Lentisphaerota bacterium]